MLTTIRRKILPEYSRNDFVVAQLARLPRGSLILDAGCGGQPYRKHCHHLVYRAQDFGQYTKDEKTIIAARGNEGDDYRYGHLDYVGDIWSIDEKNATFDAILCTEVLEHIPNPGDAIREFSRLLKSGGTLILTAPSNCLRHMDPYFFYSGFSEHWYESVLTGHGFTIESLEPVGDYYSWLALEMARTARGASIFGKLLIAPAFLYYLLKKKTVQSTNSLCQGYHVVAVKR